MINNKKYEVETYKSLKPYLDTNKDTYVISNTRTDLLGSFTQGILIHIIDKSEKYNILLDITNNNLTNFAEFKNQNLQKLKDKGKYITNIFETVGTETEDDHKNNRKKILDILFNYTIKSNNKNFKRVSSDINFNLDSKSIKERTILLDNCQILKNIREMFVFELPSFIIPLLNSGYIAIHFRAGEITNMSDRYLHSSEYTNILKDIRKFINLPIFVFISDIPSTKVDNLDIFKKYNCIIITNTDSNTLNTIASFVYADIFIMARSSLSFVSSLIRNHKSQITFYKDFWHKKPHINIYDWDINGIDKTSISRLAAFQVKSNDGEREIADIFTRPDACGKSCETHVYEKYT
jgi:hypothetical protein